MKVNSGQANVFINDNDDKTKPKKEDNKAQSTNKEPVIKNDSLDIKSSKSNTKTEPIKIFDDKEPKSSNPWKVKSVHMNYGYIIDTDIMHTGKMRLVNEQNNTDLTITGYKQEDRKNFEYLQIKKGQRFAPDEPQFNVGFNAQFENNFGIELDGKHNKIIMDGYDQTVHFKGTMNGQDVDMDAPLKTFVQQHENTYGNMQISALGTYNFDLPAPKNHKFSFITKAGPSLITTTTHSRIQNPDGSFDGGTSKIQVSGYGGIVENGLRYQFGPKVGRLGVEATHSLSYLNYSSYGLVGGTTASHSAVYNTFAVKLTMGLYGNKK
ncbi:MAG: hypothetical protein U0354_04190 [Candidatus Sericytochromatia bacterium]